LDHGQSPVVVVCWRSTGVTSGATVRKLRALLSGVAPAHDPVCSTLDLYKE